MLKNAPIQYSIFCETVPIKVYPENDIQTFLRVHFHIVQISIK